MVSWAAPSNVIGIDPQLIDPENGDYRVTPGSPAEGYGCQVFPTEMIFPNNQKEKQSYVYENYRNRNSVEVSGIIDEPTCWQADTVKIIGDIEIVDQVVLTIAPSTKIEFQDVYSIDCKGSIRAVGEDDGRICFTSAHPELFAPDSSLTGSWNGIRFHNTSYNNEQSIFSYCDFSYSKAFGDSVKGGVFSLYNYSKVRIENCSFTQNCADYGSVLGVDYQSSPEILNCIFDKNYAFIGGSPVYSAYSYPRLVNNTIVDNYVLNNDINYRTGAVQSFISKPQITNNIVWNNVAQYIVQGQITECKDFYTTYNDIEYEHGGMGNIDLDPQFDYSGEYRYSLMQSSPCIDTGTPDTINLYLPLFDFIGNDRIYGGRIDMGALEWQGYSIDDESQYKYSTSAHPNPFSNSTTITFNATTRLFSDTPRQAEIKIYNVKGQLVRTLPIHASSLSRLIEITWDGKDEDGYDVKTGIYFFELTGSNSQIGKIVKIR